MFITVRGNGQRLQVQIEIDWKVTVAFLKAAVAALLAVGSLLTLLTQLAQH